MRPGWSLRHRFRWRRQLELCPLTVQNEARQTRDIATNSSRALTIAGCAQSIFRFFSSVDSQAEDRPRRRDSIMPVPFETLLPYGIMIVMFGATGTGLAAFKTWQNEGKRPRYSLDQWDRVLMDRDRRLTGTMRGQTDNPQAPLGFEFSNGWKLEKRFT
ncbi:hypothetical protein ACQKWADRAFT_286257, partial [Trichoderma austrokoningii]